MALHVCATGCVDPDMAVGVWGLWGPNALPLEATRVKSQSSSSAHGPPCHRNLRENQKRNTIRHRAASPPRTLVGPLTGPSVPRESKHTGPPDPSMPLGAPPPPPPAGDGGAPGQTQHIRESRAPQPHPRPPRSAGTGTPTLWAPPPFAEPPEPADLTPRPLQL